MLHVLPKKLQGNGAPKAFAIEVFNEEGNSKGANLFYARGKEIEQDALILFRLDSTHKFISHELELKIGIHEFEVGDAILANGAFKGKKVSITHLIRKLRAKCSYNF